MNFIISIGGTGTKCTEALTYLMAANFLDEPEQFQTFIVDKDATCGNTARCHNTIGSYHMMRDAAGGAPYAGPSIHEYSWCFDDALDELNRVRKGRTLQNTLCQTAQDKQLLDLVFSRGEQEKDLEYGFYGHPSLGSAIFDAVTTTDSYQGSELFQAIRAAIANGNGQIHIFLVGSIFGGTGASVFPNIAKSIRETFCTDSSTRDMVKISGALLLPYFCFPAPAGSSEEDIGRIQTGEFFKKTAVALTHYHNTRRMVKNVSSPSGDYIFDSLYVMGSHPFTQTCLRNTPGGKDQLHDFHVVDLFAAMSAASFFNHPEGTGSGLQIFTPQLDPGDTDMIGWENLPDGAAAKTRLASFARFSVYVLSYLQPYVNRDLQTQQKDVLLCTLYGKRLGKCLITDVQLDELRRAVNDTAAFCFRFLVFLSNIQQTQVDPGMELCRLFDAKALGNLLTRVSQGAPFSDLKALCRLDSILDLGTGETYITIDNLLRDASPELKYNKKSPINDIPRALLSHVYRYCSI